MPTLRPAADQPRLTQRFIVALNQRVQNSKELEFLEEDGFRHLETFDFREENFPGMSGDMLLVELRSGDQLSASLAQLSQDPRVEFVEADIEFELQSDPPEDPETSFEKAAPESEPLGRRKPNDLQRRQWGLDNSRGVDIDAPEAWGRTVGRSNGPVIAVIDTGVDTEHPDLVGNLWTNPGEIPNNGRDDDGNGVVDDVHGFDAFHQDGQPEDVNGHGTHCAGIIGATGNNGRGITGVNWQTRIMPVKIFDNSSSKPRTNLSSMLRGVAYATNNGARLTSNSWGSPGRRRSLERAFATSRAFHVCGAGNDAQDNDATPFYPASYRLTNSVSVASVTRSGSLSSFSNFGDESVDLAAPGSSIYSTLPGGRYGTRSGTSMATPHVTGVAGLLLSVAPGLSNGQLRSLLLEGVEDRRELQGKVATGGVVNADKSLTLLGV